MWRESHVADDVSFTLTYFYLWIIGVREQQNQRSSFIDGTALYGFNQERETLLRELSKAWPGNF